MPLAGSGAHLFEDALAYRRGYALFWPLSDQRCDTGAFEYTRDWNGIANSKVMIAGVITLGGALVLWWVWRR